MNVTLAINGSSAPSTYRVGSITLLTVLVDGLVPLAVEWSYGLRAGPRVTGIGSITFIPTNTEPYYVSVTATTLAGVLVEQIFILNVTATGDSAATVSVVWANPAPLSAGDNSATINVSGVVPARSVAWSHYANGVMVDSGHSHSVPLGHLQPGIHRIFATVIDEHGNTVVGDSSIHVPAAFGLPSAVVPPQPIDSSLVYLGAVFSPVIEGEAFLASALPLLLTSFEGVLKLIPGSTHFAVDIDPLANAVDDEVVVRTQLGNWTLKGPPTGLTAESLPYDYQHEQPFQPAPMDLGVRYVIDAWNVHGLNVAAFNFRVRFRCFVSGDPVYRYTPCEWSSYSGGTGERQRRLLAVVTEADLSLDDETPQNRGGSRDVQTFTAPNQKYIIGNFEASGQPDRPAFSDDHFYTDQNVVAVYECDGFKDVPARATYGMPSVRPCILDFSQVGSPRIVNRVQRLNGKLAVYVAGGALNIGTVITVRITTGKIPGYEDVPVTVRENVYNPDYSGFVKAGEANIDISDFEFSRLGVIMDFTVNEANAGTAVPSQDPMMTVGEDFYYTKTNAPAIRIDTACFKGPVLQASFEGTFLGSAVALDSCNTLACGPQGTYCYVELGGTGTFSVLQPLGFPAPFIAPYGHEAHCYGNPSFFGEYLGGHTTLRTNVTGYTGTTGCGAAYQYNPCSTAATQQLAVVFPSLTSPHPAVAYNEQCYTLVGAVSDTRNLTALTAADVTPVTGCTDVICTGSSSTGASMDYIDQENFQQVTVTFPHIDSGIPLFGVAREAVSQGYGNTPPGQMNWSLWNNPKIPVMSAVESASVDFRITPANIWRELVVTRAGARQHYRFYPGLESGNINLQAGDEVTLEFANYFNRYKGTSGQVSWSKQIAIPYLYDSVTFALTASTGTITALGFCGLSSRQEYCFYGTMGARVEMDLPNPDAVVTVKDSSSLPEMVLVRTKQPHEVNFQFDLPAYQAQKLTSPVTLKFYAGRNRAGAHGEMDVWLTRQGTSFPSYLKVSDFKSLAMADYAYRKSAMQTDTSRRALRVVTEAEARMFTSPRIHVDDRGRKLSVVTDELNDYVFEDVQPYTFTGDLDYGISEKIYRDLTPGGGPVLVNQLSVPAKPRGLCYVASQDEVWVACPDSSSVLILSGDGLLLKQTLTVADFPYSTAYCADTDSVAIACMDSGSVKFLDAASRLELVDLSLGEGNFYHPIDMLVSYNPTSLNVYVAGVPNGSFDLGLWELDPRTSVVRAFPFGVGAAGLADLFYCPTTLETIVATESGGSWAFNVNTTIAENLDIPTSTSRGACSAPEIARVFFSSAANPPSGNIYNYDPRSRRLIRTTFYSNPVRATGWHPRRRKLYLSTLSIFGGGPGVAIVDTNGNRLTTVPNYDWGHKFVYSPISRLMFNTVPATFFGGNYVTVYT